MEPPAGSMSITVIHNTMRQNPSLHPGYAVAMILLLAASFSLQFFGPSSPDKDWLLLAARMWVGGKTLYEDIFESNPPLILWIYALPALVAPHLPAPGDVRILTLMGMAACAASILLSSKLIALHPQFASDRSKRMQFALLMVFILIFDINPTYFFDREHIFMLFTFPYILRWMPSLASVRLPWMLRFQIGLMAGIGFCIKPHCLLVFAGLQLFVIVCERRAIILGSIENLIIYSMGASYGLLIAGLTPRYFSVVLPMELATYSGYNMRSNQLFYTLVALFSLAVVFVDFRLRFPTPWRRDMGYFAGMCLLCLGYALTNNGWGYTFVPLFCMLLLIIAFTGWDYQWLRKACGGQGMQVRSFVFGERACAFVLCAYAVAALVTDSLGITYSCAQDPQCKTTLITKEMLDDRATSFGTLTMDFKPWTDLARISGAAWQTRFNHLWMLPALVTGDKQFAAKNNWIKTYIAAGLSADLGRNHPDIVFVDASPEFYTTQKHMDLVSYFSSSPPFEMTWRQYGYLHTLNFCSSTRQNECRYDIYKLLNKKDYYKHKKTTIKEYELFN